MPSGVYRSFESAICDHNGPRHASDLCGLHAHGHNRAQVAPHGSEQFGGARANGVRTIGGYGENDVTCKIANDRVLHMTRRSVYKSCALPWGGCSV